MMASVVAFTGLVLAGSLGFPRALESAFCDNDVPAFVEQYRYGNRPILCNKMYVRGVYFFTGNPVAVIDSSATPFWSPHPVDVLYQDAQLRDFFKDKDLVICVVKDGDLKRLEKLFSGERRQIVLSKNFKRVVAVSQKL